MDVNWNLILKNHPAEKKVIVTDNHLYRLYKDQFEDLELIVIPSGEEYKVQSSVDIIIHQLLELETDHQTLLIGFGGGMITDLTGFAASIFKRGIPFAFIPTSIMAMADAALGGKNGINYGALKNVAGVIRQPEMILYDFEVLKTLPAEEWRNGMAEIIKYGCINDRILFETLEKYDMYQIQSDNTLSAMLIERCVKIKMNIVAGDETDKGGRRKLNFGHTLGHAIERLHELPHGHAISIGMVAALALSEKFADLHFEEAARVVHLLNKYHLPVNIETDPTKIFEVLKQDKKRIGEEIHFVLLKTIGTSMMYPLSMNYIERHLKEII